MKRQMSLTFTSRTGPISENIVKLQFVQNAMNVSKELILRLPSLTALSVSSPYPGKDGAMNAATSIVPFTHRSKPINNIPIALSL